MKTVGDILSEKRKSLGLSFDQIEKETKIRQKYLRAIEENDYSSLPEIITVKGFLRNYALILNLPPETIMATFRRDFIENEKGLVVARSFSGDIEREGFHWTPKLTFITLIFLTVFIISFFFLKQYLKFSSPPDLIILSPKEGQIFKEKIVVFGETEKDATIKIDGSLVTIDDNGSFKEEVVFPKGENVLTIEAENRQGRRRTVNIKVKVE